MKTVVSISLGTSKRNKTHEVDILGQRFRIERRGTDGDLNKFADLFTELDGKVDALGIGGCDLHVVAGSRRYTFRQIRQLVAGAKSTPVVDGSGLKHTLERQTIRHLAETGQVDFANSNTLLVSAVDRFGMAEALVEQGGPVVFGDLMFGIGLPLAIRKYRWVKLLGATILPVITQLPFQWFYPTGEKQETRTPRYPWVFQWADVIAGDWHFIRRYAPDELPGKTIITQTLRKADLEWLKSAGASRAIATTPIMGGESFATNVMEGVCVALLGRHPDELDEADYLGLLAQLGWQPTPILLQEMAASS